MFAILLFIGALALGLHLHAAAAQANAPVAAVRPPTPVTVKTLEPRKIRLWTEFSGRLHAIDYAEIRPEVSGYITQVKFADGQMVKQGDLLVVIDPRPYEAAVERDEAVPRLRAVQGHAGQDPVSTGSTASSSRTPWRRTNSTR